MKKFLLGALLMLGVTPYTAQANEAVSEAVSQTAEEVIAEFTHLCRNLFQQFQIASAIGQAIQNSQVALNKLKDKLLELGMSEEEVKELFEKIMQGLTKKAEEVAAAAQAEAEDAELEN